MLAGQGFGRWGLIVGNVLMAFGAPVFVTSLVSTVAAGRAGAPTRQGDAIAIAAGAAFMIAGLVCAVASGRARHAPPPLPTRNPFQALDADPAPAPTADGPDSFGGTSVSSLSLTFNTLDDYYTGPDNDSYGVYGGLALADDDPYADGPAQPAPRGRASVPAPRQSGHNSRGWNGTDRFCEPQITGKRSTGTRRRPPAG